MQFRVWAVSPGVSPRTFLVYAVDYGNRDKFSHWTATYITYTSCLHLRRRSFTIVQRATFIPMAQPVRPLAIIPDGDLLPGSLEEAYDNAPCPKDLRKADILRETLEVSSRDSLLFTDGAIW